MATKRTPTRPAGRTVNKAIDSPVLELTPTTTVQHNTPALQSSREVAAEAPANDGPMADAIAWIKAGGKTEDLRELLQMQREHKADVARETYHDAMAAFKQNPPIIVKDKHVVMKSKEAGVKAPEYWHASLAQVVKAIVHTAAQHGFSHRWDTRPPENGRVQVTCIVTHKLGHSESTTLDAAPDASGQKNGIQQMASAITYLQRYTLLLAYGLAAGDRAMPDDDGRGAGGAEESAQAEFDRIAATIDPKLVQTAKDAAMLGWKPFAAWIHKITAAERLALEPISAALKDAALAADEVPMSTMKGMK